MKQYVVCITLKTTGSRRNQIPHFILPLSTRCPALFSRIFYPAFYPLSLPHPALPLFTHSLLITVGGDFCQTVVKNGTLGRLAGGIELHCGYLRPLIYTTASKYAGCLWYCCTFDENLTKTWRTAWMCLAEYTCFFPSSKLRRHKLHRSKSILSQYLTCNAGSITGQIQK